MASSALPPVAPSAARHISRPNPMPMSSATAGGSGGGGGAARAGMAEGGMRQDSAVSAAMMSERDTLLAGEAGAPHLRAGGGGAAGASSV